MSRVAKVAETLKQFYESHRFLPDPSIPVEEQVEFETMCDEDEDYVYIDRTEMSGLGGHPADESYYERRA